MKKIICIMMSITLILSVGLMSVSAKEKTPDDILLKNGVPNELIEMMPLEQKNDIINNNLKFISYEKVTMNEMEQILPEESYEIRGTIPASDLSFYISTYHLYPYNSTDKKVAVYVNYDWSANKPIMRWTDPFGIAWDSNIWQYEESMWFQYYRLANGNIVNDNGTTLGYAASNGVGWNADIKWVYNSQSVMDNYGFGKVILSVKNPSTSGTTSFQANYSHVTGVGSIGLNFVGISVSYSGGASANSRGVISNFSY